jgi:hypothetical protein
MRCELRGGPKDGGVILVDDPNDIFFDQEWYFPHDSQTIQPVAAYRWLFGAADHLDFAGYEQ